MQQSVEGLAIQVPEIVYEDVKLKWDHLKQVILADKISSENREMYIVDRCKELAKFRKNNAQLKQDLEESEQREQHLIEELNRKG